MRGQKQRESAASPGETWFPAVEISVAAHLNGSSSALLMAKSVAVRRKHLKEEETGAGLTASSGVFGPLLYLIFPLQIS